MLLTAPIRGMALHARLWPRPRPGVAALTMTRHMVELARALLPVQAPRCPTFSSLDLDPPESQLVAGGALIAPAHRLDDVLARLAPLVRQGSAR